MICLHPPEARGKIWMFNPERTLQHIIFAAKALVYDYYTPEEEVLLLNCRNAFKVPRELSRA
jgi:hypothetical protein